MLEKESTMEIIVDQLNNEIENLVENYKDIISQVNVIENKMNVLTQRIDAHSTNLEEADYEPNDKETLKHIFTTMKCTIDNLDIIRDAKLIHNSTKNRKKVKFRYFNKGYCKFGNKCSFLHPQNMTKTAIIEKNTEAVMIKRNNRNLKQLPSDQPCSPVGCSE